MFRELKKSLFALGLLIGLAYALPARAGEVLPAPPRNPDTAARYLFYMHGGYVERRGGNEDYRFGAILEALAAKGFVVIGEERDPTSIGDYARRIADQVRYLLGAGVPVENITIGGHSKGGFIALVAATRIVKPDIKYAIMSACGLEGTRFRRPYSEFIRKNASKLKGHFLVAWAADDNVANDCDQALDKGGVPYENKVLPAGQGHKLFYAPAPVWIDLLAAFASGK